MFGAGKIYSHGPPHAVGAVRNVRMTTSTGRRPRTSRPSTCSPLKSLKQRRRRVVGTDTAVNVYFMADLGAVFDRLGERGSRVAQVMYLAAAGQTG